MPARSTQAPTVAGFQAAKAEFRHRYRKIVATRPLRIDEAPVVETHLVKSSEAPGGFGEAPTAVVAPAVTNAIFAATAKRIRTLLIDTNLLKFPS